MRLQHLGLFYTDSENKLAPNFPKLFYLAKAVNIDPDPFGSERFSPVAELYESCQNLFNFLEERQKKQNGEEIHQTYIRNIILEALKRKPLPSYEYASEKQLPTNPKPWWLWIIALLSTPVEFNQKLAEAFAFVFSFQKIHRLYESMASEVKSHLTAFLELKKEGFKDFALDLGFMLSLIKSEKFNYPNKEESFFLFALLPALYKKSETLPEALRNYYLTLGLAFENGRLKLAPSNDARVAEIKNAARPFLRDLQEPEFLVFLRKNLGSFSEEIILQGNTIMLRAKNISEIRDFLKRWELPSQEILNTEETWFSFDANACELHLLNYFSQELMRGFSKIGIDFICERTEKSLKISFTNPQARALFITKFPELQPYFIENNPREEYISVLNLGLLDADFLFLRVEHQSNENLQAQVDHQMQQMLKNWDLPPQGKAQTRTRTKRNRSQGSQAYKTENSPREVDQVADAMINSIIESAETEQIVIKEKIQSNAKIPSPFNTLLCEILKQESQAKFINLSEGKLYVTVDDANKALVKERLGWRDLKGAEERQGSVGTNTILIYRTLSIAQLTKTLIFDPLIEYFKIFSDDVSLTNNQRIQIVFQLYELEKLDPLRDKHPELARFIEYNDRNDTTQIVLDSTRIRWVFSTLQAGMAEMRSGMAAKN